MKDGASPINFLALLVKKAVVFCSSSILTFYTKESGDLILDCSRRLMRGVNEGNDALNVTSVMDSKPSKVISYCILLEASLS